MLIFLRLNCSHYTYVPCRMFSLAAFCWAKRQLGVRASFAPSKLKSCFSIVQQQQFSFVSIDGVAQRWQTGAVFRPLTQCEPDNWKHLATPMPRRHRFPPWWQHSQSGVYEDGEVWRSYGFGRKLRRFVLLKAKQVDSSRFIRFFWFFFLRFSGSVSQPTGGSTRL